MILTSSSGYWATCISLRWNKRRDFRTGTAQSQWSGRVNFYDDAFCSDDPDTGRVSTEGTLRTRYMVRDGKLVSGLQAVIDTLIADAQRLGITFNNPFLCYDDGGESAGFPPPDGFWEMLAAEAARIGWECSYSEEADHG